MGKNRKSKPYDPAQAAREAAARAEKDYRARRNPSQWGTNDEALALPANADVGEEAETRTRTRRVQRFDCFATIKLADSSFTSVRRYQHDLAASFRAGGRPEGPGGGDGSEELYRARQIAATKRCDDVRSLIGPHEAKLLDALSIPAWVEGTQPNWHRIVLEHRGWRDRAAQTLCVRLLAGKVVLAYAEIDNGIRRAA